MGAGAGPVLATQADGHFYGVGLESPTEHRAINRLSLLEQAMTEH
jgi:hypothetical protein